MRLSQIAFTAILLLASSCQTIEGGHRSKLNRGITSPCMGVSGCDDFFKLSDGLVLPIYRSYHLTTPNKKITRAVVIIHGNSRNGDGYFSNMMNAAIKAKAQENTLVVAPNFFIDSDKFFRKKGEVYWDSSNRWKKGSKSSRDYDYRISSFAAVDFLLHHIANQSLFPNLSTIIIAGHSAGGQFVQRYSIGHQPNVALNKIHLRFIIANPGRYFYFNEYRIKPDYKSGFEIPKNVEDCAYNRYEYGMEKRNSYMNQDPPQIMIERFKNRDVVLMVGERDNDPDARGLNTNCKSMLQGRHRLERAIIFKQHLDAFFSPHKTRFLMIPKIGHSNRGIFQSPQGLDLLFQ